MVSLSYNFRNWNNAWYIVNMYINYINDINNLMLPCIVSHCYEALVTKEVD